MPDKPLFSYTDVVREAKNVDANHDGKVTYVEVDAYANASYGDPLKETVARGAAAKMDMEARERAPYPMADLSTTISPDDVKMAALLEFDGMNHKRTTKMDVTHITQSEFDYESRGPLKRLFQPQSYEEFMKKNADKYR